MITIDRRTLLMSAGSAAALATLPRFALGAGVAGPLVARIEPVSDTYFGQTVVDPYRWMENPNDRDWAPFMKGQAEHARAVLDRIPGRAAIAKRVSALSGDVEFIRSIQAAGPHVFVEKRPAGANNYQLFLRAGLNGAERLLIDPESRTKGDVNFAMNYWSASPDGSHVAYGMSPSGSEDAVIEILETATGKVYPERIDRAQYAYPSWHPDGTAFFFNRLAEGGTPGSVDYYKDSVCWLHRIGTDAKADVKVLYRGQFADVSLQDIDFPLVESPPGSGFAVAYLFAGVQNEITMYVNSRDDAAKGQGGWKNVCVPDDKVTAATIRGDDIYLVTYKEAPRYRVLHVKATDPAFAKAREVVAQGNTVIQNVFAAKDAVYVQELDGGIERIRKLGADGKVAPITLPFEGTIHSTYADTEHDGIWFQMDSWVRPPVFFQVDASGAVTDTKLAAQPDIDVSPFDSTRLFATAKDGTRIPVSVVYRKDLKRDGSAPLLLDAYGSYGSTSFAVFLPRFIAWLEKGGVWATAHVRGGGEYGREWHDGGRLLTKHNTWGDLIAAAEHLIADRWTSAAKLAIRGVSAGGITVGRAVTESPDRFAAVISDVGVSNTVRAEFSQNGPPNVPEFGSVTTPDGFKGLYAMDSYLHVRDGTKYPALLLLTGITDPRVDPWQAAKMAARVQKATASGKPVLLRVDYQAGHGLGSTRAQLDAEYADIFAFIFWQAGVADFQPAN